MQQQRRSLPVRRFLVRSVVGVLGVTGLAAGLPSVVAGGPMSGVGMVLAQNLPTDERLVVGELDNGLRYIVRKHAVPPGRAALYLHVSSGSLNETDKQRGIAHYLEHMAFNGSTNFPPGSVVPFFQGMGLSFGRDQNAFTSFDQTTYQLTMPDNKVETVEKAMLFFADVGSRLNLAPKEINEERQIILEEKRSRSSGSQRVQEYIFERLAPGSIFGQRIPIGVEETLLHMGEQDFRDYYQKWYVPSNMTLLMVADMDEKQMVELITKNFGGGEKKPKPADQDVGVKVQQAPRAIVASDSELTDAEVSINRVEPPRAATVTVPQFKEDLIERLAQECFGRRMERKRNDGKLAAQDVSAGSIDLANTIHFSSVTATGEPGKWKAILTEMGTELQRARKHGFSAKELEDAKTRLISGAERSVQVEGTLTAGQLLGGMNQRVSQGEPLMSPQQRLALMKEILPSIEAKDVSWAFSKMFDPANATFIAQMPSSAEVPSEEDLLKLGLAAVNVEPEAEGDSEGAKTLMAEAPKAGTVVQMSEHQATGVHTAMLGNNVLVHHRFMDYKKNDASISITMAGGEIQETAANRGVTEAATLIFNRPATGTLSSNEIEDIMSGKKVGVRGRAGRDSVNITISGSPAELEAGLQLAHVLLTGGKLEQAAYDQWKVEARQRIEDRKKSPQGMIQEAMSETIAPAGETRLRPMEEAQLNKLTREEAQEWFTRLAAQAPMEVSVVGDIKQDEAMALVTKYLGSLAPRAAITGTTLDELRTIKRPTGPLSNHVELATQTPLSVVINGFFGADQENLRDVRLLQMAARIISTRMIKVIREEEQLVYSIGAQSLPGTDYPGYGMFFAAAPTEPGKTDALDKRVSAMYAEFAQGGPTDEEMEVARKQFANTFDEQIKEPGFWAGRLASLEYRSSKLDDILAAPEAFQQFTAAEVKEAFAKYYTPEATLSVIVKPAAAPEKAPEGAKPEAQPAK